MKKLLFAFTVTMAVMVAADTKGVVQETTVCQLLKSPAQYSGSIVRVRAELRWGRRILLYDGDCGPIPWVYPSDRDVTPKPDFELERNAEFKNVESTIPVLLPDPNTDKGGSIRATVEGRFDSVFILRNGRVSRAKRGFGHLGLYTSRIVLHNVRDVEIKPPREQR